MTAVTFFNRRMRILASCFAAIAGYVDAIGFLVTGGFFVSFMSGNSTRMAIGLADGSANAAFAALLLMTFVAGVVFGALVGRLAKARRRPAVLLLVTMLLAAAATLNLLGADRIAIIPMVLAMGAENTVFAEDGEVRIGLTYMTGTLVKLGKRITAALLGGDRLGWMPYLLLWLGLLTGAVLGALMYQSIGVHALWGAVSAMAVLTVVTMLMRPDLKPSQ